MANRIIAGLPYFQAQEFAVGANHPDGMEDTINRGLVTAWSALMPQIRDTVRLQYNEGDTITVLPGIMRLTTGEIVIIDTAIENLSPDDDFVDNTLYLIFFNGGNGIVASFYPETSVNTMTKLAVFRKDGVLPIKVAPFRSVGDWMYTAHLMRMIIDENLNVTYEPTYIINTSVATSAECATLTFVNSTDNGVPNVSEILVYYTLTPTVTASVDFHATMPESTEESLYKQIWLRPFHSVALTGTTPQSGYLRIPSTNRTFMMRVSAGTVEVKMELRGYSLY